jgi:hypothetical protein
MGYDPALDEAMADAAEANYPTLEGSEAVIDAAVLQDHANWLLRRIRACDFKMAINEQKFKAERQHLDEAEAAMNRPLLESKDNAERQLAEITERLYGMAGGKVVTWPLPIGEVTFHSEGAGRWSCKVDVETALVDWLVENGRTELLSITPAKKELAKLPRKPFGDNPDVELEHLVVDGEIVPACHMEKPKGDAPRKAGYRYDRPGETVTRDE